MSLPMIEYVDQWGECSVRPTDGCSEIRWFDTTSAMEGDDFNSFLAEFATVVEGSGHSGAPTIQRIGYHHCVNQVDRKFRDIQEGHHVWCKTLPSRGSGFQF